MIQETETEEIESISLVRLRLITHNARLVDARKERGMIQLEMAQRVGVSQGRLRDIENLRVIPTEEEIVNIACTLEKPTDYLFPEELLSAIKASVFSRRKVELTGPQVIYLTQVRWQELITDGGLDAVEEKVDREMLALQIHEVMSTLKPIAQHVLTLRFGLDGKRAKTMEEVGREFHLTRERIRQIESKALRKLRHPSRSRKLKDYLD